MNYIGTSGYNSGYCSEPPYTDIEPTNDEHLTNKLYVDSYVNNDIGKTINNTNDINVILVHYGSYLDNSSYLAYDIITQGCLVSGGDSNGYELYYTLFEIGWIYSVTISINLSGYDINSGTYLDVPYLYKADKIGISLLNEKDDKPLNSGIYWQNGINFKFNTLEQRISLTYNFIYKPKMEETQKNDFTTVKAYVAIHYSNQSCATVIPKGEATLTTFKIAKTNH
jgi:hypothetical protein